MCLIRTRSEDTTPTVLIKLLTADGYLTHRYKSLGFSERFDEDDNENMLKRIRSSPDIDLREHQSEASSGHHMSRMRRKILHAVRIYFQPNKLPLAL